jgi:hypothetical protein
MSITMRVFTVAFALSIASIGGLHAQDKLLSASDRIRVEFLRGREVSRVKGGSIGEKIATFTPTLIIHNEGMHDFRDNQVCLLVLGEDTTMDGSWKVILRREFKADLLRAGEFEWKGEPVQQGFDRTLAKSGFDYDGYIVQIRNSAGELVHTICSKAMWAKNPAKLWDMKEGQEYGKTFFQ